MLHRIFPSGVCTRGRVCPYKHDPSKIAICWPFLQGSCPNTAENCSLSHDPTPERTPLCVHFANNGRCKNGDSCLFPHVHVGVRNGVCRDFAVLGYCEKGLDCDKQHVRECPDFAERGTCPDRKCKLPHVIRANRRRETAHPVIEKAKLTEGTVTPSVVTQASSASDDSTTDLVPSAEEGNIGDEYISLTFHESDEDEATSDGDDEDGEEASGSDEEEDDDTFEVHA